MTTSHDATWVAKAYLDYGYTLKEIAAQLEVHYFTVSRRVC